MAAAFAGSGEGMRGGRMANERIRVGGKGGGRPGNQPRKYVELNPVKMVYIGCGFHLDPVKHFKTTKEFIFIDTIPSFRRKLQEQFHKLGFYLQSNEATWIDMGAGEASAMTAPATATAPTTATTPADADCLSFYNSRTRQSVRYYISAVLDETLETHSLIAADIETADALIVRGFIPHASIVNMIRNPFVLICYNQTYFRLSTKDGLVQNPHNLLYYLHNNKRSHISAAISDIYLLDTIRGTIMGRFGHIKQLCDFVYSGGGA